MKFHVMAGKKIDFIKARGRVCHSQTAPFLRVISLLCSSCDENVFFGS
jgi:formamidopyrimidine-DNA glycosylase